MEKIKIYTTTFCPWCKMVEEFLSQNKIPFEEINVEKNPDKAKEMIKKSGQAAVPVIDINGQIIVGYDREKLKKALKLK